MTERELILGILSIKGVKETGVAIVGAGLVNVKVRYALWTYLLPFVNHIVSRKVQRYIESVRPIGIQVSLV